MSQISSQKSDKISQFLKYGTIILVSTKVFAAAISIYRRKYRFPFIKLISKPKQFILPKFYIQTSQLEQLTKMLKQDTIVGQSNSLLGQAGCGKSFVCQQFCSNPKNYATYFKFDHPENSKNLSLQEQYNEAIGNAPITIYDLLSFKLSKFQENAPRKFLEKNIYHLKEKQGQKFDRPIICLDNFDYVVKNDNKLAKAIIQNAKEIVDIYQFVFVGNSSFDAILSDLGQNGRFKYDCFPLAQSSQTKQYFTNVAISEILDKEIDQSISENIKLMAMYSTANFPLTRQFAIDFIKYTDLKSSKLNFDEVFQKFQMTEVQLQREFGEAGLVFDGQFRRVALYFDSELSKKDDVQKYLEAFFEIIQYNNNPEILIQLTFSPELPTKFNYSKIFNINHYTNTLSFSTILHQKFFFQKWQQLKSQKIEKFDVTNQQK